jgi:hypothetical protein
MELHVHGGWRVNVRGRGYVSERYECAWRMGENGVSMHEEVCVHGV